MPRPGTIEQWGEEEIAIFDAYDQRCVLCVFQYAVALHEEPPRSLNPNWKDEPWNRFPLCAAHHDAVQSMSRYEAKEMLLRHQEVHFPNAIKIIKRNNEHEAT